MPADLRRGGVHIEHRRWQALDIAAFKREVCLGINSQKRTPGNDIVHRVSARVGIVMCCFGSIAIQPHDHVPEAVDLHPALRHNTRFEKIYKPFSVTSSPSKSEEQNNTLPTLPMSSESPLALEGGPSTRMLNSRPRIASDCIISLASILLQLQHTTHYPLLRMW